VAPTDTSTAQDALVPVVGDVDAAAESLARNSQVINAMGMLSESILHWGRRQAPALTVQSQALDRNFWISGASKFVRLVTQITILGTGAYERFRCDRNPDRVQRERTRSGTQRDH
jgi:ABC-type protease/lipase transport system fused ATPase/permease subunit